MMGRAIGVSVVFALIVQLGAFAMVRTMRGPRIMIGWGLGTLLRLIMLLVYGWGIVPLLGLPVAPALLTVVGVFFVTMLVEPLLLTSHGSAAPKGAGGAQTDQ